MKPLSVGKIPADIGLRWLVQQPVHCVAPGISSIEQLEADVAIVEQAQRVLSAEEQTETERTRARLDRSVCRICDQLCQSVCEADLEISLMIHHDVLYEHYRNLGLQGFLEYPLTGWARRSIEAHFSRRLAMVQACTRCGLCEARCPHGLAIIKMLEEMLVDHPPLIAAARERGWSFERQDAELPPWIDPKPARRS